MSKSEGKQFWKFLNFPSQNGALDPILIILSCLSWKMFWKFSSRIIRKCNIILMILRSSRAFYDEIRKVWVYQVEKTKNQIFKLMFGIDFKIFVESTKLSTSLPTSLIDGCLIAWTNFFLPKIFLLIRIILFLEMIDAHFMSQSSDFTAWFLNYLALHGEKKNVLEGIKFPRPLSRISLLKKKTNLRTMVFTVITHSDCTRYSSIVLSL